jgi:hypothetical protein
MIYGTAMNPKQKKIKNKTKKNPKQPWTEISETVSQSKPFLFINYSSQVFMTATES